MSIRIEDILTPERTLIDAPVSSKKKLLEYLASFIAGQLPDGSATDIFERFLSRERLGSTGVGEGIAIPHCRLPQCQEPFGVLVRLAEAIDYDAMDHRPVDIVFALIVPEEADSQHLQVLSLLARNLTEPNYRDALRNAPDAELLYKRALNVQEL
ncbi:MAG: PTS sugar transporter subunit IIA [Venatoribacter sp.]